MAAECPRCGTTLRAVLEIDGSVAACCWSCGHQGQLPDGDAAHQVQVRPAAAAVSRGELSDGPGRRFLRPREAGWLCGVSRKRVISAIHAGELEALNMGSRGRRQGARYVIPREALLRWLRSRRTAKATP